MFHYSIDIKSFQGKLLLSRYENLLHDKFKSDSSLLEPISLHPTQQGNHHLL